MVRSCVAFVLVIFAGTASAQLHPRSGPPPCDLRLVVDHSACAPRAPRHIEIETPLVLDGKLHGLALLQLFERANTELERAKLEKRSFVLRLVETVDDAAL